MLQATEALSTPTSDDRQSAPQLNPRGPRAVPPRLGGGRGDLPDDTTQTVARIPEREVVECSGSAGAAALQPCACCSRSRFLIGAVVQPGYTFRLSCRRCETNDARKSLSPNVS